MAGSLVVLASPIVLVASLVALNFTMLSAQKFGEETRQRIETYKKAGCFLRRQVGVPCRYR